MSLGAGRGRSVITINLSCTLLHFQHQRDTLLHSYQRYGCQGSFQSHCILSIGEESYAFLISRAPLSRPAYHAMPWIRIIAIDQHNAYQACEARANIKLSMQKLC